ncbi:MULTISPECIES: YXWGXW repeat-containing protein [Rhodanobacter]|uniref:YXWGXW repeat-containing protein n=1 Tax=Rhodanobacter hydrolyticus TaxID=2250595 RepID=A0ABW8J2U0_9GAMM|nr:YXWGXW repeat-containing protein [Rhodanobacter sp. 7MK24]MBD8879582.1 YXWGXW repeat-containing protein [Rhodanobacter sp. 7MK24]
MQAHTATINLSLRRQWLAKGAAALLAAAVAAAIPSRAHAGVFVSVNIAPPPLPVYVQPAIPAPGYIWTPGYWAWNGAGYYWVPGAWILPPYVGALWTPGYWGWSGGVYLFHAGYWGRTVGYYGGINYGYGYGGHGYDGGYWHGGGFYYNRSVNHITNNITNVYNRPVAAGAAVGRASFNGGPGGVHYTPRTSAELRSANYAPRSNAAGYQPASNSGYRPTHYQPQNYYHEQPAYRPAQQTYRPPQGGNAQPAARPTQYARPAPAAHGGGNGNSGGQDHHHH